MPQLQKLTLQDKLALAMTTAGSQRNLAALLGITHQKLGRWLREGEPGGVKSIPTDSATVAAINQAFKIHATVAREQARIDEIPFDQRLPVFAHRKPLRNGAPGDRVIVEHTQYLKPQRRNDVVAFVIESERYYSLSIRSSIELSMYFGQVEARSKRKYERTQDQERYRDEIGAQILRHYLDTSTEAEIEEDAEDNRVNFKNFDTSVDSIKHLNVKTIIGSVFTKYENVQPGTHKKTAIDEVNKKLRQKHEPATGVKGTHLADQMLLQLIPANYVKAKTKPKRGARKARK